MPGSSGCGTGHAIRAQIRRCPRPFGSNPVTDEFLDEQQRADLLLSNGLLTRPIQVRDAVVPWIGEFVGTARSTV